MHHPPYTREAELLNILTFDVVRARLRYWTYAAEPYHLLSASHPLYSLPKSHTLQTCYVTGRLLHVLYPWTPYAMQTLARTAWI